MLLCVVQRVPSDRKFFNELTAKLNCTVVERLYHQWRVVLRFASSLSGYAYSCEGFRTQLREGTSAKLARDLLELIP